MTVVLYQLQLYCTKYSNIIVLRKIELYCIKRINIVLYHIQLSCIKIQFSCTKYIYVMLYQVQLYCIKYSSIVLHSMKYEYYCIELIQLYCIEYSSIVLYTLCARELRWITPRNETIVDTARNFSLHGFPAFWAVAMAWLTETRDANIEPFLIFAGAGCNYQGNRNSERCSGCTRLK